MTDEEKQPPSPYSPAAALRARAEARLRAPRSDIAKMSPEDVAILVHELQIHQIELEIQNEELQRSHLRLAESRDRYADLYEFAPVGYLTFDAHGDIAQANLAAAAMLATDREELLRKNLTDFIAYDGQDEFYFHRQAVFAGDDRQTAEISFELGDGSRRVFRLESRRFPEENSPGDHRCLTALVDVTLQRRAEDDLRELNETLEQRVEKRTGDLRAREKQMRFLTESIPHIVFAVRPDGAIEFVNRRGLEFLGGTLGEIQDDGWTDMLHPDDADRAAAAWAESYASANEFQCKLRLRHSASGDFRWHYGHAVPVPDDDGGLHRWFGTATDIHERILAENELRRMSKVFMEAADPILILELDGTIRDLNDEMVRLYGWSREGLVGESIRKIVPEGNYKQAEELLERCAGGEAVRNVEGESATKSGEIIPILLTLSLLTDENGEPSGIASISKDLRALKRTEMELRESRAIAEMHRDIAYMANMASSLEEAFTYCLEKITFYNGWIFGHAWFPSATDPEILLATSEHYAADRKRFAAFREVTLGLEIRRGEGLPGCVYASGKAEWTNDVGGKLSLRAAAAEEAGIKTAAAFPVLVGEDVMGVMEFFSEREIEIDARLEESMAAIGAHLGRVIERDRARRLLKESEARLRELTERLRDAVWMHEVPSFQVIYCNVAFEVIFDRPREVFEKDPAAFLEDVHADDRERVGAAIERMRRGEELDEEFRIVRRDNSIRWLRNRGYPIRNESGEIHRFVGTAEDITSRREAERTVQKLNRRISDAAENERQRIARDLHDGLGGLLSAIDMRHQILVDRISDGELPDLSAAEMVSEMIREGIAESRRLTRGLQPVGEDPEDLMSALRDLIGNIRALAPVACHFRCPEPVLIHDRSTANELFRIAQEATNNAVKHSGAGQLTIGLKEDDSEIVLSIEDNGKGFEPEEKGSGGEALGFGLKIMKHRARAIGGTLEIGSRQKGGGRIICRVPVVSTE